MTDSTPWNPDQDKPAQPGYGQPGYGPGAGPQPGGIPLRPLGLTDILNGAVISIRRNPRATLGLAAIILSISGVASALLVLVLRSSISRAAAAGSAAALSLVVSLAVSVTLTGMLTSVIGRGVLGRQVSIAEAWQVARPRLAAVLGALVLGALIVMALYIPLVVLVIILVTAHTGAAGVAIGLLGFVLTLFVTVGAWVLFSLTPAAVVLERLGPWRGLRRSWQLVRGSFWRVLGILLLTVIIIIVASLVLQIPFYAIEAVAGGGIAAVGKASTTSLLVSTVASIIVGTITRPLLAGVTVLLYLDMRMRKEGLDLVLQQAALGRPLTGDEFAPLWQRPSGGSGQPATPPAW